MKRKAMMTTAKALEEMLNILSHNMILTCLLASVLILALIVVPALVLYAEWQLYRQRREEKLFSPLSMRNPEAGLSNNTETPKIVSSGAQPIASTVKVTDLVEMTSVVPVTGPTSMRSATMRVQHRPAPPPPPPVATTQNTPVESLDRLTAAQRSATLSFPLSHSPAAMKTPPLSSLRIPLAAAASVTDLDADCDDDDVPYFEPTSNRANIQRRRTGTPSAPIKDVDQHSLAWTANSQEESRSPQHEPVLTTKLSKLEEVTEFDSTDTFRILPVKNATIKPALQLDPSPASEMITFGMKQSQEQQIVSPNVNAEKNLSNLLSQLDELEASLVNENEAARWD